MVKSKTITCQRHYISIFEEEFFTQMVNLVNSSLSTSADMLATQAKG